MQCVVQCRAGLPGNTRARDNDDIEPTESGLGMAKSFPGMALYAVARNRRTRCLAGYGQPEPGTIEIIGNSQHGDPAIACLAAAMPEYPLVVAWLGESRLPGKTRQAGTQGKIRRTAVPGPWRDVP